MSATEFFDIVKDIATSGAAVAAAIIAAKGLKTWRRQLHGQTEYALARRILQALYEVREEISNVRRMVIHPNEMVVALREDGVPDDEIGKKLSSTAGSAAAYGRRWRGLVVALNKLRVELFEAEAIWGSPWVQMVDPLFEHISTLQRAIWTSLDTQAEGRARAGWEARDATVYDLSEKGKPDEYATKLQELIARIEASVRPHLSAGASTEPMRVVVPERQTN